MTTEAIGRGVVIVPNGATVIGARPEDQILSLPVRVGKEVKRGQTARCQLRRRVASIT
ncbi:MAG: hypothetical protein WAM11_10235 [Cyanobium sp.]